ncbi:MULTISPECIES: ABC transporter substrate-binding protein [Streptomyces]|uniref:Sugar ABC transporter substrate-binding protein n=1 Tax=Streptomyces thermoviolaceus subsp. thermoviolaceus TaxID=66860 RepID=A0ABX0Z0Y9_STRTL|nr:sugar ABC transporter substrate-binding protein [Streptomyces thermoviolaceus]MCM3266195.1 sugar ABC transporter substrate-binding protein [Streptomyces thermoviolaceus]NJP16928.1 sugar ABC transporter substrate-binding protein [Streptomyces thermoviolaceus subsp. thermoviolaceus]WTD46580.1 sugar ABC transporter substrate-binding protein [Streptomyces thermoviolaceus]GGV76959.1 sugar ABC transporter substrate-binding protein [Streptomyces thermoviolaceus subsp. apingens]GHB03379.1 sugar ABC
MRSIRAAAVGAVTLSLALTVSACGGGTPTGGGSNDSPKTLTYWASNQGAGIEIDKKVLQPELDKFEKQTGIKVKLEVVPWNDLLNRILTATTSGQGPDVLNIGNTWSASLQATGALLPWDEKNFAAIGGKDRFVDSALGSTGAPGKDPAAVPLYSMAYGLYYNKKIFAEAGISEPPATWAELIADGKKIQAQGKQALGAEGASLNENVHHVFVFAKQHGADFFTADGKPDFTSDKVVAAVKQYVDLMAEDKVVPPGNAEYAQNQSVSDFAKGRTAMLLWQTASANLKSQGMNPDDYGVAPVPVQSGTPGSGTRINSMVAGVNVAVFNNTHNLDGAKQFVKFLTSDEEQKILNKAFSSIPPVKSAQADPAFNTPETAVLKNTLATSAAALPQVPSESQFETTVGTAVKELFADAAAGRAVTTESVKAKLLKAQQQMPAK